MTQPCHPLLSERGGSGAEISSPGSQQRSAGRMEASGHDAAACFRENECEPWGFVPLGSPQGLSSPGPDFPPLAGRVSSSSSVSSRRKGAVGLAQPPWGQKLDPSHSWGGWKLAVLTGSQPLSAWRPGNQVSRSSWQGQVRQPVSGPHPWSAWVGGGGGPAGPPPTCPPPCQCLINSSCFLFSRGPSPCVNCQT